MINRIAKGNRTQKRLREMLEDKGYLVYMIVHSRYQKDIWGLWDGCSLKQDEFFFLQAKTNTTGLERKTQPHRKFCEKYNIQGKIFNWLGRKKEWHIIEYP